MGNQPVGRASAVVGLALIVAACGASDPSASGPAAAIASAPPAPVASPSRPASTPTASPTAGATPAPIVVPAASLEPALKQVWQAGGPPPPKDGACCVTLAPDGAIWASTGFGSSFWIIGQDGKPVEQWGSQGSGDGQFDFVVQANGYGAVAFGPDGTFYVADTANHRVQKFDKDRTFIKAWGTFGSEDGEFVTPASIASDSSGLVYVADWDRLDVQVFTAEGAFLRKLASGYKGYFIATDPNGRLYADDGSMIRVFDTDGKQLPGFDLSATGWYAGGMAFDAAGNMYVSLITTYGPARIETKATYELDASGKLIHAWPGQADSLALSPDGSALYSSFYRDPFIRKLALPTP